MFHTYYAYPKLYRDPRESPSSWNFEISWIMPFDLTSRTAKEMAGDEDRSRGIVRWKLVNKPCLCMESLLFCVVQPEYLCCILCWMRRWSTVKMVFGAFARLYLHSGLSHFSKAIKRQLNETVLKKSNVIRRIIDINLFPFYTMNSFMSLKISNYENCYFFFFLIIQVFK